MDHQAKAPPEIQKAAQFLRGASSGLKVRVGAVNGKRLDYFKGKSAIKALLTPAYAKLNGVPTVTNEAEAHETLKKINASAFFLRVQRGGPTGKTSSSPKSLQIIAEQLFSPNEYYAWFYEGSQWTTYAGGLLMVAIMLAGVMFPLWPPMMRLGVWYLSVGMLGLVGLFFGLAIVRLIFYVISIFVASPGIWLFPQLFADVGFVESFIPVWEWDLPKKKSRSKRADKERKEKSDKGKEKENGGTNTLVVSEDVDSEASRPQSRSARIEEVEDE